jgi:hypothetical protein
MPMTRFLQKFDQLPKLSLGGELGGANINGKFAKLTAPTQKRDLYLITFHPCQSVYRAASRLHWGCSNQFVKITTPLHPSAALTRTSVTFGRAYLKCALCQGTKEWVTVKEGKELFMGPPWKTLKLAIFIFFKFWFQIWFQKYYISPSSTQFLINKHKNRGRFLFNGAPWKAPCPLLEQLLKSGHSFIISK